MSSSVPVGKAKPALCSLVKEAYEKGRSRIITVGGEPHAQIGPVVSPASKLTSAWKERRKGIALNPKGKKKLSIPQIIQEGRK